MKLSILLAFLSIFQPPVNDCLRGYQADAAYELAQKDFTRAITTYQEAIQNCPLSVEEKKKVLLAISAIYIQLNKEKEAQKKVAEMNAKKAKIAALQSEARRLAALSIREKNKQLRLKLAYEAKCLMDSSQTKLQSVLLAFGEIVKDSFAVTQTFTNGIISNLIVLDSQEIITKNDQVLTSKLIEKNQVYKHKSIIQTIANNKEHLFSVDKSGILKIWDSSKNELKSYSKHTQKINFLKIDTTFKRILTGADDSLALIWDYEGNLIKKMPQNAKVINGGFSKNGERIWTKTSNNSISVWEGNQVPLNITADKYIYSAAFLGEGKILVTVDASGTINKYDEAGKIIYHFKKPNIPALNLTTNKQHNKFLVTFADGTLFLGGQEKDSIALIESKEWQSAKQVMFSPAGNLCLSVSGNQLQLIELNGVLLKTIHHKKFITKAKFSPDGNKILLIDTDFSISIYDENGYLLLALTDFQSQILDAKFSNNSQKIIAYSKYGKVIRCLLPSTIYERLKKAPPQWSPLEIIENNLIHK